MRAPSLALLALLSGCGDDAPSRDLVAELGARGPHAVGYRSMSVTYDAPITGAPRTIEVLVWYPAQAVSGDRPLYLVKASELAVIDAPALDLGQLPVVVFSHGHQAYASVMSFFMEHLASHGFLAIAPMHTDNTFIDGPDRATEIYYLRAHDVRVALDRAGGGGPALVMGHSFGGYTAYALGGARFALPADCAAPRPFCSSLDAAKEALFAAGLADDRLKAIFAIDSGDFDLFGAAGVGAISRPVLHMVAEQSVASRDRYWDALMTPERARVILRGGAHNDFTDSCGAGVMIQCSATPPAQAHAIVRIFGLAFARRWLLGDADVEPVLSGALEVSPLAGR